MNPPRQSIALVWKTKRWRTKQNMHPETKKPTTETCPS